MSSSTELMWGELSRANELNPAQRHRWRLIVEEAARVSDLSASPTIIDLGCGSGRLLSRIRAASPKARLLGFDVDSRALELARHAVPDAEFHQADLSGGDASAGALQQQADVVLCSEVIEHLENPERAVRLARALLKPGGAFIVTVPVGTITAIDRAIGHLRHYTLERMQSLLEGDGFRVRRSYLWGFPFHTLFRVAVGMVSGVPTGCTDENFSAPAAFAFRVLNGFFYLNAKSRRWGRQLVAIAVPDSGV